MKPWSELAQSVQPDVIRWRHEFHQHPELSFQEVRTTQRIAQILRNIGYTHVRTGMPREPQVGVVADLNPGAPGKTLLLRADIDALPVEEQTGVPYASRNPGVMHACGHDAHIAMLLGAAKLLYAHREALPGNVRLLFQPCEESNHPVCGKTGAQLLTEESDVLDGVDAAFTLHVWGEKPTGTLFYKPGAFMSANMTVTMRVRGVGGHGALPQNCVDPVVIACQIVTAWQTILSREVAPLDTAVLTVGGINVSDAAYNIIPEEVTLLAGLRTYDTALLYHIAQRMEQIASGIAQGMRASVEFESIYGGPPVVNDEALTNRAVQVLTDVLGSAHIAQMQPVMPSEDFAWYLSRVPGTMMFLGCGNAEKGTAYPQHHCKFNTDDDALAVGVAAFAAVAEDFLTR